MLGRSSKFRMGGRGLPKASTYGAEASRGGAKCLLSIVAAMALMSPLYSGWTCTSCSLLDLNKFRA